MLKSKEQTKLLQKLYFHLKRHPKKSDKCKKHSCEWHKQRFTVNASSSLRERERDGVFITTNQHSFLLCIISKATWRNQASGRYSIQRLVVGTVASICSNIGTFFFFVCFIPPSQDSLVKGNMLHIKSDTHTRKHTNTHKSSDTKAAINLPPIVVWCELLLNLINHR